MASSIAVASFVRISRSSSSLQLVCSNPNPIRRRRSNSFRRAASQYQDDSDCNDDECAPDKEVGKVSVEWLAGEKTRVVGTYPPRQRGWTGYVEKDIAGQTNIYSVEDCDYDQEGGWLEMR